MQTVSKATLTRRLEKLAHTETANIARRYKLPEAAADIIDKAGEIHGQKSRAIQIGVEIFWRGLQRPSLLPGITETPLVGRSYKLPPRTISCIETLAKENALTQGQFLAAVATVLAEPEPRRNERRK